MNPVVVVHFIAALIGIGASIPLIGGRIKMNHWYGVRIPAAFASDKQWYEINRFGGRLLLFWSAALGVTAVIGALLNREYWGVYDWCALAVVILGLMLVITLIHRFARSNLGSNQSKDPAP